MRCFILHVFFLLFSYSLPTIYANDLELETIAEKDSIKVFNAQGGRIPDFKGEAKAVKFPIEISGLKINENLGLVKACFSISHKRTSDLKIELQSPSGESIWLSNRNGGLEGKNYQSTCFSQTGFSGYIHQGQAPFNGDYLPDGRLEFLNQNPNPNGTWILSIYDLAIGVEGTLSRISLSFGDVSIYEIISICNEEDTSNCFCPDNELESCTLLPDLVLLEEFTSSSTKVFPSDHPMYPNQLRFSVSIANFGIGPFEVILKEDSLEDFKTKAQLLQVVYEVSDNNLKTIKSDGGTIFYDNSPGHDHYHVDNWVEFKLYRVKGFLFWKKKIEVSKSKKISFCLFDSGICDGTASFCKKAGIIQGPKNLPNYGMGNYVSCDPQKQGISVGGYDTYGYSYEGQHLDLPENLPKGKYQLEITIDPLGYYKELDTTNNKSIFDLNL